MNKLTIITVLAATAVIVSCSDVKRKPGTVYIPDMGTSRAYESYADHSNLTEKGIHYNSMPVTGTISREEEMPFHIMKDVPGDTSNYFASRQVKNPFDSLTAFQSQEAERLYLINCGICHGSKLNGNGPLYNDGKGPYPVAPKNLIADPLVSVMPDGQMFYSIAYGKNLMGSYSSQLNRKQRWMVIKYIKNQQLATKAKASGTTTAVTDTTGKK